MPIQAGAFDEMLSLIAIAADPDRTKRHVAELRDAGTNAAREEAEKYADGLSKREAALDRREAELRRVAAELEERAAAGAELPGRIRAADVRDGELDSKAAALQEVAAQLDQKANDLQVKERDLDRRLALIRRAAVGPA
jgi:hypothetical protein